MQSHINNEPIKADVYAVYAGKKKKRLSTIVMVGLVILSYKDAVTH